MRSRAPDDMASARSLGQPSRGFTRRRAETPQFSIARAAELLSLSRSTIYELIWRGELSPIHIGRSVRLPTQQLEAFVDRHTSALDRNRSL